MGINLAFSFSVGLKSNKNFWNFIIVLTLRILTWNVQNLFLKTTLWNLNTTSFCTKYLVLPWECYEHNLYLAILEKEFEAKCQAFNSECPEFCKKIHWWYPHHHLSPKKYNLNEMFPSIQFNFESNGISLNLLDLTIYRGEIFFSSSGCLDFETNQKPMNPYMYIPYTSEYLSSGG